MIIFNARRFDDGENMHKQEDKSESKRSVDYVAATDKYVCSSSHCKYCNLADNLLDITVVCRVVVRAAFSQLSTVYEPQSW